MWACPAARVRPAVYALCIYTMTYLHNDMKIMRVYGRARRQVYAVLPAATLVMVRRADNPPHHHHRPSPSLPPVPSSQRERRGAGAGSGPPRRAPGLRPIRGFVFSCCGSQVACSRPSDSLSRVKAILFILRILGFIFTFRFSLNRFKVLDSAAFGWPTAGCRTPSFE